MKLPVEWETNLHSIASERVDAQPPINFEDMNPFEPCEVLDYEIHFYSKLVLMFLTFFQGKFPCLRCLHMMKVPWTRRTGLAVNMKAYSDRGMAILSWKLCKSQRLMSKRKVKIERELCLYLVLLYTCQGHS